MIMQALVPVAFLITPVCGSSSHIVALIPREVGEIDSQHGLIGGQSILQAGDCNEPSSVLYSITTNHGIWFAMAQRDPHTWGGWAMVQYETVLRSVVSTGVQWVRDGIDVVVHVVGS